MHFTILESPCCVWYILLFATELEGIVGHRQISPDLRIQSTSNIEAGPSKYLIFTVTNWSGGLVQHQLPLSFQKMKSHMGFYPRGKFFYKGQKGCLEYIGVGMNIFDICRHPEEDAETYCSAVAATADSIHILGGSLIYFRLKL